MTKASLPGDPRRQQQPQQHPTVFNQRQLKQAALNQAVAAAETIESSFDEYFDSMIPDMYQHMIGHIESVFTAQPVRYVSLDEWEQRRSIGGATINTTALPGN